MWFIWRGKVWYSVVWYGMVWYGMVWYGMVRANWYGTCKLIWYVQTESIQTEPYRAFAAIRIWSKYEKIANNLRIDSSTILLTSKSLLLWSSFCKQNNRMFHLKTLSLLRENSAFTYHWSYDEYYFFTHNRICSIFVHKYSMSFKQFDRSSNEFWRKNYRLYIKFKIATIFVVTYQKTLNGKKCTSFPLSPSVRYSWKGYLFSSFLHRSDKLEKRTFFWSKTFHRHSNERYNKKLFVLSWSQSNIISK